MKMTVMTVAVTVKTMLMRLKTCWRMTRGRLQLSGWKASTAALEMTPENGAGAEESGDGDYPLYSIAVVILVNVRIYCHGKTSNSSKLATVLIISDEN